VLLRELLDQRVKSPADLTLIPRTRVLGIIPHAMEDPGAPSRIETVFRDQPRGIIAEGYRQLRGQIWKRMQQNGHRSLAVMSGMPQSGATTVAINLAYAFAASEHRVLLIDANMRRPAMHKVLGLSETPGLADVLAGHAALAQAVQKTDAPLLSVLSAGASDKRVYERLSSAAMSELLAAAGSEYDVILLDVAPAMVAGDAMALANRCDASLLVVRALGEKRGMVARIRNDLSESKAEFLGIILNAVRSSAGGYLKGNIMAAHAYQTDEASASKE
jgi:capsular exopolysaccharide synthesis family protein